MTLCKFIGLPTRSLIINSQLATHRTELQLTTRKLAVSQVATRQLLGFHFTDTQLADCILESHHLLIKIGPGHCFGVTLAHINR